MYVISRIFVWSSSDSAFLLPITDSLGTKIYLKLVIKHEERLKNNPLTAGHETILRHNFFQYSQFWWQSSLYWNTGEPEVMQCGIYRYTNCFVTTVSINLWFPRSAMKFQMKSDPVASRNWHFLSDLQLTLV